MYVITSAQDVPEHNPSLICWSREAGSSARLHVDRVVFGDEHAQRGCARLVRLCARPPRGRRLLTAGLQQLPARCSPAPKHLLIQGRM